MTKTNKKGFTLIELIIVIAILAILVAALAPALLRYIEKSRVGKDQQTLDNVYTAIKTAISTEEINGYNTADTWTKLSDLSTATGKGALLYKELWGENATSAGTLDKNYFDDPSTMFKSNDASGKVIYFCVMTETNGYKVSVCLCKDGIADMTSADFAAKIGYVGEIGETDRANIGL